MKYVKLDDVLFLVNDQKYDYERHRTSLGDSAEDHICDMLDLLEQYIKDLDVLEVKE